MRNFNATTQNKLDRLFEFLPEVFFWTVIVTRAFIALPLFIAAKVHFAFLHYPALIVISSLVSVAIVESVLTLPSLSAAFFKHHGLHKYQRVAFWSTIFFGLFNQSLILLAWKDTGMSHEALYIYSVLNFGSIILAEFISYMTATRGEKDKPDVAETESPLLPIPSEIIVPTDDDTIESNGLPSEVNNILNRQITEKEKAQMLIDKKYSFEFVGEMLNRHHTTIRRWYNQE